MNRPVGTRKAHGVRTVALVDGVILWDKPVERILAAESVDEILAALRDLLASLGYVPHRCEVCDAALSPLPADHTLSIPIDRKHVLVLETEVPLPNDGTAPVHVALAVARARLARALAEQSRWTILLDALSQMTEARSEQAVLNELAVALQRLFSAASVYVFRYCPDVDGLSLEAVQHQDGEERVKFGHVFPLSSLPTHREALERGHIVQKQRSSQEVFLSSAETTLFPPRVARVLIAPFWLGMYDFGVVSLGYEHAQDATTLSYLSALLNHVTLAVERVRLNARVEWAQAESQQIMEGSVAGMMMLSSDAYILKANAAAAALWESEVSDLLGRPVADFLGAEIEQVLAACHTAEPRAPFPREWRIITPDGRQRDLLLAARLLPASEKREPSRYLLSFLDISPQKQAERLRRQMITNVTHEMRTPIAIIRGYAELLQEMGDQVDTATRAQALDTIQSRANDLLYMVESYIDLSRLESGEFTSAPEVVDLVGLVHMLIQEYAQTRQDLPHIHMDVAPPARRVWIDPHLFRQIVRHLLDNAVKFTPAAGEVTVRAWCEGATLHLSIADTGTGIDTEDIPRVFDVFYRGQNAGFGVSGSGVGLALVRAAVRYLGGEVRVESEKGKGSVFHITLPGVVLSHASKSRALSVRGRA